MIQGTNSNAGKSLVVAGLCRLFQMHGLRVAPFKPQNMSNNAAAVQGGEIGRAQALQALACGIEPTTDMNPILLKPEGESGSQVIVQGKKYAQVKARDYFKMKAELLPFVIQSYERLQQQYDIVIVEGAGSPAEVNLRAGDIANMGFAEAVNLPVVMVADIEQGGVIANLVGCFHVLNQLDRDRIKGYIINKFRGDISLFDDGILAINNATGWADLGVLPFFEKAHLFPAEDSLELSKKYQNQNQSNDTYNIAVLRLPRIANFDDIDPLAQEDGVSLSIISHGNPIPVETDLIIIPGSKATISDLEQLKQWGWHYDIYAHIRRGGRILGLCGGYQMLGNIISDPDGIEGKSKTISGLSLLDVETVLTNDKTVRPIEGVFEQEIKLKGYEIHLGVTTGEDCSRPLFHLEKKPEGAQSMDGKIMGSYLHGLFSSDEFRNYFLEKLTRKAHTPRQYDATIEQTLTEFAQHLEQFLSFEKIQKIAGL